MNHTQETPTDLDCSNRNQPQAKEGPPRKNSVKTLSSAAPSGSSRKSNPNGAATGKKARRASDAPSLPSAGNSPGHSISDSRPGSFTQPSLLSMRPT